MVPMPTLSLKNDSPIAASTTAGVIADQSGWNRKRSPSPAPGSVRLRMQTTTNSTNRIGNSRRVTRSIPLDTPAAMIAPTQPSTIHCRTSDIHGFVTSVVNT